MHAMSGRGEPVDAGSNDPPHSAMRHQAMEMEKAAVGAAERTWPIARTRDVRSYLHVITKREGVVDARP